MLDSPRRYAQATRANQRINQLLRQENESASSFLTAVRTKAVQQEQAQTVNDTSRVLSVSTIWISFTFLLCYLALPLLRVGLGLTSQTLFSVMGTALASAVGLMGVLVLFWAAIVAIKPRIAANVDPDRILSATSGSLLIWGLLHNILPGLSTFDMMGTTELTTFIGSNVIESSMFGVMLASFASTGRAAFSLGALFQTLFFGLSYVTLLFFF